MTQIVEAVNEIYNIDKHTSKKLFLAGGITISDVIKQTRLARPKVLIVKSMHDFIKAIKFKLLSYND
jgi:phosphoribosylanthranilate isomerase